ncbi:MAG: DUF3810 domain-containing protein, partial [Clostridia bacterium]|nr:DUF3810 domain-containing protein [Clostridia bacterium]
GAVIHFICALSPSFSDFINSTAGYAIRLLLSKIFSIFPFSFMEYLLYSSPLIITVVAVCAVKCAGKGGSYILRALGGVLSIAAGIYFLFAVSFAPGYHGTSLAEKTGLEQREVSAEELYETELIIIDELNGLCESISYEYDGSSLMPFSLGELSKELSSCYEDVYRTYGFPNTFSSKVKPLIISPLMTYTHLSGIYSFFTGEANLNTNYPHFVNVFTSAHEMAHQRGVAREDEANFMAFLVCRTSENDYVRYCAYMNMFEYLSDALYSANKELWAEAYAKLSPKAVSELRAYSAFFDKYRESTASRVTDTLNNAYLESQGTEGTKSYGMVVDLAVSFYLD